MPSLVFFFFFLVFSLPSNFPWQLLGMNGQQSSFFVSPVGYSCSCDAKRHRRFQRSSSKFFVRCNLLGARSFRRQLAFAMCESLQEITLICLDWFVVEEHCCGLLLVRTCGQWWRCHTHVKHINQATQRKDRVRLLRVQESFKRKSRFHHHPAPIVGWKRNEPRLRRD